MDSFLNKSRFKQKTKTFLLNEVAGDMHTAIMVDEHRSPCWSEAENGIFYHYCSLDIFDLIALW